MIIYDSKRAKSYKAVKGGTPNKLRPEFAPLFPLQDTIPAAETGRVPV